ncbi:MAG: 50S ribosomal protein L24 [Leptospirillum sp.]|jgi:large subunit ribosomal protein L24
MKYSASSNLEKPNFPAIKKNDKVKILSGKDKGKEGQVLRVDRGNNKLIVEDINKITKAVKPDQKNPQGGFLVKENFLNASKVMIICPSCKKTTRVKHVVLADGKKVRSCIHCSEHLDK